MIANLLLLAALSCPKPFIVNTTKFPWNDFDRGRLESWKKENE